MTFLESDPTPSSLAVLQPDAAAKLAEVEPDIPDDLRRDRLVRALVLIDDRESHDLLVELLNREPERVQVAFDTAQRYQKLVSHLDLLYDQLEPSAREAVYRDVCWPALVAGDDDRVSGTCRELWAATAPEIQARWVRGFTVRGPHDDPAPYELLLGGASGVGRDAVDEVITRVRGGDVIPADPDARLAASFSGVLTERLGRLDGARRGARTVSFDGGYVEIVPLDPRSEFGRVGNLVLDDLPQQCLADWGAAAGRSMVSATVELRLRGSAAAPTVEDVGDRGEDAGGGEADGAGGEGGEDDGAGGGGASAGTPLARCLAESLAETHAGGRARWIPRFGITRLTFRTHLGEALAWSPGDGGRAPLSEGDLRRMAEALRESGTAAWLERIRPWDRDALPLRDLGAADLGFCLAYTAAGWDDCAAWLGEVAAGDDDLAAILRRGLRDTDPNVRLLCRRALSVSMDEESIAAAAAPESGDDDSADGDDDSAGAPGAEAAP